MHDYITNYMQGGHGTPHIHAHNMHAIILIPLSLCEEDLNSHQLFVFFIIITKIAKFKMYMCELYKVLKIIQTKDLEENVHHLMYVEISF